MTIATRTPAAIFVLSGSLRRSKTVRRASGDDSMSLNGLSSTSTSSPDAGRLSASFSSKLDTSRSSGAGTHSPVLDSRGASSRSTDVANATASLPGNGRRPAIISNSITPSA